MRDSPDSNGRGVDVLVFVPPGLGHYHPIAGLVSDLTSPAHIAVSAQVLPDHPVAIRSAEDGFQFIRLTPRSETRHLDKLLVAATRVLRSSIPPRVASLSRKCGPIPALLARVIFAVGSDLVPIRAPRLRLGEEINRVLIQFRPRLVFSEGYDEWLSVLCSEHNIPYVQHTTGPVGVVRKGRPVWPAGLDPALPGIQRPLNCGLQALKAARLRRSRRSFEQVRRSLSSASPEAPYRKIAFSAAELDDYESCPSHDFQYLGVSLYRSGDKPFELLSKKVERDTILITFGSGISRGTMDLIRKLLFALDSLSTGYRIGIQTGDAHVKHYIKSLRNSSLSIQLIDPTPQPPYDEYIRSKLVISHGGYGTINESVAFGAPVLVIPEIVADRMETAQRVANAGVGASVDRYTLTVDALKRSITHVLSDDRVQARVDMVGSHLRERSARSKLINELVEVMEPKAEQTQ